MTAFHATITVSFSAIGQKFHRKGKSQSSHQDSYNHVTKALYKSIHALCIKVNYNKEYLTGRSFIDLFSHIVLTYGIRVDDNIIQRDREKFTKIFAF